MAWNKTKNHQPELDPWGKKHSSEKDYSEKKDQKTTREKKNSINLKNFI